jgi:hypothetical protein
MLDYHHVVATGKCIHGISGQSPQALAALTVSLVACLPQARQVAHSMHPTAEDSIVLPASRSQCNPAAVCLS